MTNDRCTIAQRISAIAFSGLLLTGMVVCAICDWAISGNLTWSLIPISAIVFAWLVCFPVVRYWDKGIVWTLAALPVSIVPFLYVLHRLIPGTGLLMPIGVRMAAIAMVYLWVVFGLFRGLKARKMLAAAVALLLVIPLGLSVNVCLSRLIAEPVVDLWDATGFAAVGIAAAVLLAVDRRRKADA